MKLHVFGSSLAFALLAAAPMALKAEDTTTAPPVRPTEPKNDNPKSQIDNDLLATIRRAIVEDKNLSVSAHNVKLIRDNDSITVKGSVETDTEKTAVEKKVVDFVGANRVVSQLVVEKK